MELVDHFLAMGGYARFVWPAFGITVIVLGGLLVDSIVTYRRRQRELASVERRRR